MAVKSDIRYVNSKKDKSKKIKKVTYKCEGSYIDIDGNPHRYHKRGFSSSEEAKEWERVFLIEAKNNVSNNITFYDLFSIYIESKKGSIKERSLDDLNYLINGSVMEYWKAVPLAKITLKKIEVWQKLLLNIEYKDNKQYSNSYLAAVQTKFKAVLKYGVLMGYISDSRICSFKLIKRKDTIKTEMLFWHPDEYIKFIENVDKLPYRALYSTLYWCGLRIGEALALTWEDINFDAKTIDIHKTYSKHTKQITSPKTSNSYRIVIIPKNCIEILRELKEYHKNLIGYSEDKFVFNFDKPLDDNIIREYKNKVCALSGVKQIRIHDFRHSHVSLLISLGFSAFDIAKRMGHSVEMVNNTYSHWFKEAQIAMVNKLDKFADNLV